MENGQDKSQLENKNEKLAYILKLKWITFFQSGFFVAIVLWLTMTGLKLYNFITEAGTRDSIFILLLIVVNVSAWLIMKQQYDEYKAESKKIMEKL